LLFVLSFEEYLILSEVVESNIGWFIRQKKAESLILLLARTYLMVWDFSLNVIFLFSSSNCSIKHSKKEFGGKLQTEECNFRSVFFVQIPIRIPVSISWLK
jgi:hypothetical protein